MPSGVIFPFSGGGIAGLSARRVAALDLCAFDQDMAGCEVEAADLIATDALRIRLTTGRLRRQLAGRACTITKPVTLMPALAVERSPRGRLRAVLARERIIAAERPAIPFKVAGAVATAAMGLILGFHENVGPVLAGNRRVIIDPVQHDIE